METLKKRSIRNAIILCIVLVVIGGIIFGTVAVPAIMEQFKKPVAWEDVDFSGDIEGLKVTGTLYFIYDAYAEQTNGSDVVAYEYIIDADDTYYIGLRVTSKDFDASEALLFASYDYMDGLDDGTELLKYQYEVTGTIKEMPSDSLSLYREYLTECEIEESEQAYFLPYYLEVNAASEYDWFEVIFLGILGVALIVAGIYVLIAAILGKNQKHLNRYINSSTNAEAAKQRIENFLATAPVIHKLRYDQNFLCNQDGSVFGETDKLIWAYKHTVNHKRYFITVSQSHSVMLTFIDGATQQFNVNNEAAADELLALLSRLCPKAIIGYSAELENLRKNNLRGFLNIRYYAPQTEISEEAVEETVEETMTEE